VWIPVNTFISDIIPLKFVMKDENSSKGMKRTVKRGGVKSEEM
jgi:hypothetical protein